MAEITPLLLISLEPNIRHGSISIANANICLVERASYVRKAMREWLNQSSKYSYRPLFNWVSIFNFHANDTNSVLAIASSRAEALMLIRDGYVVRCDRNLRKPLVYVAFIEVAPWNQAGPERRFSGLGPILLRAAAEYSKQRGFGGRLGLHSVPEAEQFYNRLGFQKLDCPNEYNEIYFELNEGGADHLIGGQGGHGGQGVQT